MDDTGPFGSIAEAFKSRFADLVDTLVRWLGRFDEVAGADFGAIGGSAGSSISPNVELITGSSIRASPCRGAYLAPIRSDAR